MTADVAVLGSANLDLVYGVSRIPQRGETVLATAQQRHCGGKGLNQAIASARAGARTVFLGAVGADDAGALLRNALQRAGIDTTLLREVEAPTGTALVIVDEGGENAIVVEPGANSSVAALTPTEREAVAAARVLVAQLEIPLSVVAEAATLARRGGTTTVLNAAPVQTLDDSLLACVDVLVVNEHEASTLTGATAPLAAARRLVERCPAAVVTLGAAGALCLTADGSEQVTPAPAVTAVDSTGAGDTFTGVLAAALAEQLPLRAAVRRAVVAGAICVERPGAEPAIPTRAEVDERLRSV